MSALGGAEKQIVYLSNSANLPVDKLIDSLSYTNDLKFECIKLMDAKNIKVTHEGIMNCASKFDYASHILNEINSKINN